MCLNYDEQWHGWLVVSNLNEEERPRSAVCSINSMSVLHVTQCSLQPVLHLTANLTHLCIQKHDTLPLGSLAVSSSPFRSQILPSSRQPSSLFASDSKNHNHSTGRLMGALTSTCRDCVHISLMAAPLASRRTPPFFFFFLANQHQTPRPSN